MPSYFCLNGATFKISDKEFDNIYRRMKDNEEVSTTEPSSEAESNEPVRNKNSEWRESKRMDITTANPTMKIISKNIINQSKK